MSSTRGAAAASAVAILGFLVPLAWVGNLDSLALDLDLAGQAEVLGTAWIVHLPVALVAAVAAMVGSAILKASRLGRGLPAGILAGGFLLAVLLGLRPALTGLLPTSMLGLPAILALSAAVGWVGALLGTSREAQPTIPSWLALVAAPFAILALVAPWRAPHAPVPAGAPDRSRPDILIITVDAMARAHMSGAGYARPTTPHLDRVARESVEFTSLIASSNFTTPTINTLLTGQQPWTHMAVRLASRPLSGSVSTSLPAILRQHGYRTIAVTTNPNAGVIRNGYGAHFDAIAPDAVPSLGWCRDALSRFLPHICRAASIGVAGPLWFRLTLLRDNFGAWPRGGHNEARPALSAAERLFRRADDGRPVALWVHLLPPHDPYVAPEPFLGRFDPSPRMRLIREAVPLYQEGWASQSADHALFKARYDEMIAAVDAAVGTFLDQLEREGRLLRTILVISADHGESFLPDYGGHGGPRLHEALVNIPFILKAPGLPQGLRIDAPVAQTDIAPTVLALAGLPASPAMEGRSLLPLVAGSEQQPRVVFTMNLERAGRMGRARAGTLALVAGDFRYVLPWGHAVEVPEGLFRRSTDPAERREISAEYPEVARTMRAALEAARRAHLGG